MKITKAILEKRNKNLEIEIHQYLETIQVLKDENEHLKKILSIYKGMGTAPEVITDALAHVIADLSRRRP